MKRTKRVNALVAVAVIAALMIGAGSAAFAHPVNVEDLEKVERMSGSISFKRAGGFTLTTSGGQKYKLAMPPVLFLEETGMSITASDRVSVSGYQLEDTVILVTEVRKGSKTYTILTDEMLDVMSSRSQGRRGQFNEGRFDRMGRRGPVHGPMHGQGSGQGRGMDGGFRWEDPAQQ
jgi:hypothetical protein